MDIIDWLVLFFSIFSIVIYGLWKSRKSGTIEDYLRGGHTLPWYTISLSVIATQASAITFLSAPGQAYVDGMRFVLFYMGLPISMVVISGIIVPIYYRLNVITAYEFLESRFDVRTRVLAAFFFLVQRGLAAGVSIAAPSIVLSVILEMNIFWINLFIGSIVIVYTVTGGSKAVSQTQKLQMITILVGMTIAGYLVVAGMPSVVSFDDAMYLAAQSDKFNTMDFSFDLNNRYTLWSGLLGGFFLQMAYFGTDQSQVGRYLGGTSLTQIRLGLLFNGIFKIPMQFSILFIGAMLFIFYQFQAPPLIFNTSVKNKIERSNYQDDLHQLEKKGQILFEKRQQEALALLESRKKGVDAKKIEAQKQSYLQSHEDARSIRAETAILIQKAEAEENKGTDNNLQASPQKTQKENIEYMNNVDANYIFITFVMNYLPHGLIGLLIAAILMASMSTTASELNALASTSVVDMYKRLIRPNESDQHYMIMSKVMTLFWGILAISFAQLASKLGTLIEAVNILGSLFYGTVLGIFVLAFGFKWLKSKSVFWAAVIGETFVVLTYFDMFGFHVAYLWLNMLGCLFTVAVAMVLEIIFRTTDKVVE
jgi:Na+/proline symporter